MNLQTFNILLYAGADFCLMLYLLYFMPQRFSRKKAYICCGAVLCTLIIFDWCRFYLFFGKSDIINFLVTLIGIVLVQFLAIYLSKLRDLRATFTAITAAAFVTAGPMLGLVALTITENYALSTIIGNVLNLAVVALMIHRVSSDYLYIFEQSDRNMGRLCILPILLYATVYVLPAGPDYPENSIVAVLFISTMVLIYSIVFRYLGQNIKETEQKNQKAVFESYTKGLELQMKLIDEKNEELRVLRHDMRHYLRNMSILLENKEYEELARLLPALSNGVERSSFVKYCENTVINGVLVSRLAELKDIDIEMEIHVNLPVKLAVNDFEFATAFSNLLENAVNAVLQCKAGNRKITVYADQLEDKKIILEIVNTYENPLEVDEKSDGLGFVSTQEGEGHGFGLRSVAAFARKSNAIFDCYAQDGEFTARLLIQ